MLGRVLVARAGGVRLSASFPVLGLGPPVRASIPRMPMRSFCERAEAFPGENKARLNTKVSLVISGFLGTASAYLMYKLFVKRSSLFRLLGPPPEGLEKKEVVLPDITHRVYLDVSVDDEPAGRLTLVRARPRARIPRR